MTSTGLIIKKKLLFSIILTFSFSVNSFTKDAITITYGANYKPFAWGGKGVPFGVQKDFVEEILAKKLGVKVINESCPWARCQKLVKEGLKDGFFTVPTQERAKYTITSSQPFYETHFVMHTSKKTTILNSLKQLLH